MVPRQPVPEAGRQQVQLIPVDGTEVVHHVDTSSPLEVPAAYFFNVVRNPVVILGFAKQALLFP